MNPGALPNRRQQWASSEDKHAEPRQDKCAAYGRLSNLRQHWGRVTFQPQYSPKINVFISEVTSSINI